MSATNREVLKVWDAKTGRKLFAVKRSAQVSVCASGDTDDGDSATCGATSWANGWMVYVDANQNNTRDSGEEILKAQGALDPSQIINTGAGLGLTITYDKRGFAAMG